MEAEFFFSSVEHKDFFLDQLAEAKRRKKRQDSYFESLAYLCGLTAETRDHFSNIFDWSDWSIRPEAAEAGWQTPLGGGAIRFKVRLVCGHPPKSGSGHGRRMRRPIRFRCAAASLLSCRSGRRGKRVRHDKPDRLAKGPYDYLLGGWRGRREFISLAS